MTNETIIKSISYDEGAILQNIIKLYTPEGFEVDPCYSTGAFYRRFDVPQPKYKFDIKVQAEGVEEADCRHLPLEDESVNSLIYDPPFLASKGPSLTEIKEGSNLIVNRFSNFDTMDSLWNFYEHSLVEFYRVLRIGGTLAVKCQDIISSGKHYASSNFIIKTAQDLGFYYKDTFILLAKTRLISSKWKTQKHSRKYHSFWLVFEKL